MSEEEIPSDPESSVKKEPRQFNKVAFAIGTVMVSVLIVAFYFSNNFVKNELEREKQAWQIRLGIVADSRAAAVNEWMDQNFAHITQLAQNSSLQLYMTELSMSEGNAENITDEPAQFSYLRNLLVATADRTGFTPPVSAGEVTANVEKVGVAGIGLTDADGKIIVGTPQMPPITGRIRKAVAAALDGEPTIIDMHVGTSNLPTMGFVLPVYGVQDDSSGTKGIGVVVGIRTIGQDLFERLQQPGEMSETSETFLVRSTGATVDYLSPLEDGTPPLKRSLAISTQNLASAFLLETPGGFAIKRNYAGEEVLATSRPLSNLPWNVVRTITRFEALSRTETRLNMIMYVFIAIIIGVGVTIIAVWRHGSSLRATSALHKASLAAERFENMTKFMNLVTNSQPSKIVAVAGDTTYTYANEPAAEGSGMAANEMFGKTMASVIGTVPARTYSDINKEILARFAESDDTIKERESHIHTFGDDEDDDVQIIKSDHIPLRGDMDYPPGVLMVLDDITELTQDRRRVERMMRQLNSSLVGVIDSRDPFSTHHCGRVAEVARCVAEEMNLSAAEIKTAESAGGLVNLGKNLIPSKLLTKTEVLTPEERTQLSGCYAVSADLLENVEFDLPVSETIRQMSESWDGSGPLGKSEDDILVSARVLSVVNSFVGMVSPRAYRKALSFDEATDYLLEQSKTKYDRRPVSALINFLDNEGGHVRWQHFNEAP
jgi:HD-GYP domain-containing protein (c-di-GMP phosphodiesterase class II)